jgi:hypothetical protein
MPYFALRAAIIAAVGTFSERNGLPGIARIRKNVVVFTIKSVKIPSRIHLIYKFYNSIITFVYRKQA